ncbi:cell division protein FtsA [Clostridium sp. 'White wine YQ']|uniref:cell division protein FtsA n=1 Tax=Clostridium sp. 'White wine YQ' TaxID=3027474 RepID=UPI002366F8B8|nr:cell division protein FtsA [Clostridium sp. 'White wine YQ']MDD7793003.1 cell division protein FtsA [Clostridium sp. 'White wine YQ']
MRIDGLNSDNLIFALDIGTRSVIGTVGMVIKDKFSVVAEKYIEHDERAMLDGQIHDIELVAKKVREVKDSLEEDLGITLKDVYIAAAGRLLKTLEVTVEERVDPTEEISKDIIRGLEMHGIKKAQNKINHQKAGKLYPVGYSIKNYYLNGYSISNLLGHKGEQIRADVIATFLPRSVVDSLYGVMNRVGLKAVNMTLEPIAAMEAVIPQNLRLLNIALIDIGAGTSDIAISSNETISAYGMVPIAGDEVTEVISQALLVDFNTAEVIKRKIHTEDQITYLDIIGLENSVSKEHLLNIIRPVVTKMAQEVGSKVIALNGGKSPSALFLVGGGARTPLLNELIAEKLNLPLQRVAIRGRESVTQCIPMDNKLGSEGVTVLGIALVGLKSSGRDFIDVLLNDKTISLFNSHNHKVMDVLIQAGINPKVLMAKNGKSLRFNLNGSKRITFGELGEKAKVYINENEETLDSKVKNGDNIKLVFAKEGKNASTKCIELIKEVDSKSFYLNGESYYLDPIFLINNQSVTPDTYINEGDNVEIIYPKTIKEIKKYIINEDINLYKDGKLLEDDYEILDGEHISKEEVVKENEVVANEAAKEKYEQVKKGNSITVIVNDEKIELTGKESYVFVDIFNFINFDITQVKGSLNLVLNDKKAAYTDTLNNGDEIKVFWD